MKVRLATATDAREVARIHVLTWQHAYRGLVPDAYLDALSIEERAALWRRGIETVTSAVLVAEEDDAMCGWIAIGPARDRDATPGTGEVWALYVLPDYWGRGAARALWGAARDRLLGDGMREATLWVISTNERARAAYERLGWRAEAGSDKDIRTRRQNPA